METNPVTLDFDILPETYVSPDIVDSSETPTTSTGDSSTGDETTALSDANEEQLNLMLSDM